MFKTLLKKQFTDIFQSFFINRKNGEAKSKNKTAASILFFVIIMVFIMGGMFAGFAFTLCAPLAAQKLDWMYFMIISLSSLTLGTFGSVFNTYTTLYNAKDNDLLLSLPIPARYIVLSRLTGVYLIGLMYSMIVFIPSQIVYFISTGFSFRILISTLVFAVIISFIILVLSCILGWVVAKISLKLKNKSFITVLSALIFLGLYYFFFFRVNELISRLIMNALEISEKIIGKAYILYYIGNAAAGDLINLIVVTAASALLVLITYYFITSSFLKIASSSQKEKKAEYHEKAVKAKSPFRAFLSKEFSHFINNPNYILNSGLGMIMMPIGAIIILIKGNDIIGILNDAVPVVVPYLMPITAALLCLVATMNDITAPSISLEGKSIWIAQSLPVNTWTVLMSKFTLHILLTEIPVLLCGICFAAVFRFSIIETIVLLIFVSSSVCLNALTGICTNLKSPNLTWTSETIAIKQGLSVLVATLGSWGYIILQALLFVVCSFIINVSVCILLLFIINTTICVLLFRWLKTKGTKIFESL